MLDRSVLERLQEAAAVHFPPVHVLAAYAYGSRISGRPRPSSDLDVGYYLEGFREGATLSLQIELQLANVLSEAAGLAVDLRNLAEAPLELRGRVLEDGIRIFSGDAARRVALERDLLARYHDYKEEYRQMHELRLRSRGRRYL
jgi:predicted nucleotidyltransferase